MTARLPVCLLLILFATVIFAGTLSAQTCTTPCPQTPSTCATCPQPTTPTTTGSSVAGELYVNAGGIWPTRVDTLSDNKIKAQGIYGLKGGVFLGNSLELEG